MDMDLESTESIVSRRSMKLLNIVNKLKKKYKSKPTGLP